MCLYSICVLTLTSSLLSSDVSFFCMQFNLIDVGNVPILLNSLKEYIYPYELCLFVVKSLSVSNCQ